MFPDFYQNEDLLRWTPSAVECYERNCACNGCPISKIIETQCLMKNTVIKLVKNCGVPPEQPKEIDVNEIIGELEKGRTIKEISKDYDVSPSALVHILKPCGVSGHHYKSKRKKRRKNEN